MHRRGTSRHLVSYSLLLSLLLLIQPLLSVMGAETIWADQSTNQMGDQRPLVGADRGAPSAVALPHWQTLQAVSLGTLRSFWHDPLGTPRSIYGQMTDVSADMGDPESAAREFLREHSGLFQLQSLRDLRLMKRDDTPGGSHLQFEQVYRGVPVHQGRISVHINPRGIITTVTNSYYPDISVPTVIPRISSDVAYRHLMAELAGPSGRVILDRDASRELVVYPKGSSAYLAWKILVPARTPLGTWEAFYDAATGTRISDITDRNYYVDGTAKVFIPNPVVALNDTSIRDNGNSNAAVPEAAYTTVTLFDLDGTGFCNGPYVNTQPTPSRVNRASQDFTDLRRGDNGFEEVETYWALDTAKRYFDSLGFFSVMNYSIGVNAKGSDDCNAYYSGFGNGMGQITLHSPIGAPDAGEDADVTWHEYGHAIMDNQIPNISQNYDGQGEGFGDYLSAALSNLEGPAATHTMYDPCLAEWFSQCFTSAEPACLRRTDNPPSLRQWPRDRGEVHFTGETWSATLYDIQQALGRDMTVTLVLDSQFRLPYSPAMPESAEAVSQADEDIYGGAHLATLNSIFTARGLYPQPYRITSPTAGDVLSIGTVHLVTWTTSRPTSQVTLLLSRNGGQGGSFNTIATVPNTGSYNWAVPGPETTQAVLRIREDSNGDAYRDHSTGRFTISSGPPGNSITVTYPNGGENWVTGTSETITWTSTGSIANVKIELSRNGAGGTYETLSASTANDGSHMVPVTGPATSNAFVRVSDALAPATADVSNSAFSITGPPSITVDSPNGGENWAIGSNVSIQWSSSGGVSDVKVELSRNGGASYESIISSTPNDGSQTWSVAGASTTNALIKISDFSNGAVFDVSNAVFTISGSPIPPIGGCPAAKVVENRFDGESILASLYRFRDDILTLTPRGKMYAERYYRFSPEVVSILAASPTLLVETQGKLLTYLPVIQSLLRDGRADLTQGDLEAVDQLLRNIDAKASAGLREAINQLRRDLRDPAVLGEFNVRIRR